MPCRNTVLMVGILSPKNRLFFGIVYGYGARTYSVVTSFGVFVDSTQGHKTTLLPLHRPFLWDYIRPALYSFRFKKKKKRKLRYSYGLNCRDKQRCAVKWLFWEKPTAWTDETSNAVHLNGFFGKSFFFKYVFSECNFTCVFICFLFVNLQFLSY